MAASGNAAIRGDFNQRRYDKGAQVHARMRQLELRTVDDLVVKEQEVEIERTRRTEKIAASAELRFDGEQGGEQRLR